MENTSRIAIDSLFDSQHGFFRANSTKDIEFRKNSLKKLRSAILQNEKQIGEALWTDLHKSFEEAYLTEISMVNQEIDLHLKKLKKWAKNHRVFTPIQLQPSSSFIMYEPLGLSLIIAPWNYPFQLLMNPLIGAISSGCCAILKPSPYTPAIAGVMENMIRSTFPPEYISVVQGNREVNSILLEKHFDIIFFTGSPALAKTVMEAASKHLTPVVLELGGKSPCIVDETADIGIAARRIAWGKFTNSGQTCIAPDYLLVHKNVKEQLIKKLIQIIEERFGNDPSQSRFYPRIVNIKALERLTGLIRHGRIRYGGITHAETLYFSPTIIDNITPDLPVMNEEIFGPVLPIIEFSDISEGIQYINEHEKPLALYYFGIQKTGREVLSKTTSGGGCINDTLIHVGNHRLPFGGVGNSGMNRYHGYESFKVFSNQRSIISSVTWMDMAFRYPPFKLFNLVRKII